MILRGILQDDPFFMIKKIQRRDCTYIVKSFIADCKIRIESVIPLFRIDRHIIPPALKVFIYVDVKYGKMARFYH